MAGFQYFTKCDRGQDLDLALEGTGLSCFIGKVATHNYCNLDGGGYVFAVNGKDKNISVGIRNNQEVVEFDDFKVIYDLDDKPKPEDFLKKDYIGGYAEALGDGNKWLVPLARRFFDGSSTFPKVLKEVSDGVLKEIPVSKYLKLSEIADKVWSDLSGETEEQYYSSDKNMINIVSACKSVLNVNYDLEWFEFSALELFTTNNVMKVLYALVDGNLIEELSIQSEKKKSQNDIQD